MLSRPTTVAIENYSDVPRPREGAYQPSQSLLVQGLQRNPDGATQQTRKLHELNVGLEQPALERVQVLKGVICF